MKKMIIFAALLILSIGAKAQTSLFIGLNTNPGCTVTFRLLAYSSSCVFITASNPVVLSAGGYTYTTTSPIWSSPLPPGAQIEAVEVTACGTSYYVGQSCTTYPLTNTVICGSCLARPNNLNWINYTGGGSAVNIHS